MGIINPLVEYNRVATSGNLQRKIASNGSATATTNTSVVKSTSGNKVIDNTNNEDIKLHQFNSLNFGKWFTWCQHCRHGGHAGCLNDWFEGQGSCGVNGCDCNCRNMR